MVQALEPNQHDYWLDPCVGAGAFIAPLRKKGIRKERIVGIDIDPNSSAEDGAARTIRGVDFFKWCSSTHERFTRIIANPPYVAIRRLHPELQRSLMTFGPATDVSFALRSNYWCAFLSASLRVLACKGNLAFVLPAAWDYALYASDIRGIVHERFQSVEVHRCREPLFPNVREGCVVLVAKGYRSPAATSVRINHRTSHALIATLSAGISNASRIYKWSTPTESSFTPFSDLYRVGIGCVTGDARYFLLRESDRKRLALPGEAVSPVLSKARHLTAGYLTSTEWNRLLTADERIWLFNPTPRALRKKAVREYLELGERTCDLEGCKLRERDPWYCVPGIKESVVGFLSGMTKLGPYISFRSKRDLSATNTLYVLIANTKMRPEERAAWALSLLSTPARRQFHEIARRYPDGLTKLEPHDVRSLQLPSPSRIKGAVEKYKDAINYLVGGRMTEAISIADSFTRQT